MTTTQMIELAYNHLNANFSEGAQIDLIAEYSEEELELKQSEGYEYCTSIEQIKFYSDKGDDKEYNNFFTWYFINYMIKL